MSTPLESELASYLEDLSAVQQKTLEVLTRRREMVVAADLEGLAGLAAEEARLAESLQACLDRREKLLAQARREGLPAGSLRAVSAGLSGPASKDLAERVRQASHRARLLQHQSLLNWVLVQKALIHLSQLLEIIATGGRLQPTYGTGDAVDAGGALVDREV
ncbi:MAG: flagellar export chaperone FlgN [Thermoguttaceae bacterium]